MRSPKFSSEPSVATDQDVQALLIRSRCPTPLHQLRTLFLGHIASPRMDISPMTPVAEAWGGKMPEFASTEEFEEVVRVLIQGLWNRLSKHQSSRMPFRLTHLEVTPSRDALHQLAGMRTQELKSFVDGLFGSDDEMELPPKAHEAVVNLAELRAMFDGAASLLADETKPAPANELKTLLRNLQQMTIAADEQINKVVQACKRARAQGLKTVASLMLSRSAANGSEGQQEAQRDDDQALDFIESPLSQVVVRNGVEVRVEIYSDAQGRWILEIVDAELASHVWDEHFETDQRALSEALRAMDEEPLEFFGRAAGQPLN